LHGRLLQPAMQEVEQVGPSYPDADRVGMQIGVAEVEDGAAALSLGFEARDPRATCDRLVGKAERTQHSETGRLQQQPGAERPRLDEALEQRDAMAELGEEDGRRLARDAAADDGDFERLEHSRTITYVMP